MGSQDYRSCHRTGTRHSRKAYRGRLREGRKGTSLRGHCDGGGGGNRTRVLEPRGQGFYARILRFSVAGPDSHRPDSDPASSLGLSRSSRSEEHRSIRLVTLTPRPPALRGERRYLVKQRMRADCRRVCAVQLFSEDLDHLGAPPCFCLLSRDRSPPRNDVESPIQDPQETL